MELNPRIFWHNTKSLRERKRLTQQQIADKLDMNVKNYNYKERGFSTKLPDDLALAVASALDTTVEELSQGDAPEEPLIDSTVARFWENVRIRREKLKLSQAEVAARIGMSTNNYQAKESGRAAKLPDELALAVASALDTTVEALMPAEDITVQEAHTNPAQVKPTMPETTTKLELTFPYPDEVIYWMNTREGATIIIEAYKRQLFEKFNSIL